MIGRIKINSKNIKAAINSRGSDYSGALMTRGTSLTGNVSLRFEVCSRVRWQPEERNYNFAFLRILKNLLNNSYASPFRSAYIGQQSACSPAFGRRSLLFNDGEMTK